MGIRDFFDNAKKKAEERLNPKPLTPEEEKARNKEAAKKKVDQLNKAFELVKKGVKIKGDVDKKTNEIKDGIARKTIDIAEKAAPIVDKIDKKRDEPQTEKPAPAKDKKAPKETGDKKPGMVERGIGAIGKGVKGAGKGIADGTRIIAGGTQDILDTAREKATEKAREAKEAQAKKPSTRSGLLDMIVPAVPETEATKPKTPPAADDTTPPPATKKPRAPKRKK